MADRSGFYPLFFSLAKQMSDQFVVTLKAGFRGKQISNGALLPTLWYYFAMYTSSSNRLPESAVTYIHPPCPTINQVCQS